MRMINKYFGVKAGLVFAAMCFASSSIAAVDSASLQLFAASDGANEMLTDGVAVAPGTVLRLRAQAVEAAELTVKLRYGQQERTILAAEPIAAGATRIVSDPQFRAPADAEATRVDVEIRSRSGGTMRRSWALPIPAALPRSQAAEPVAGAAPSDTKLNTGTAGLDARPSRAMLTSIARRAADDTQSRGGPEAALFRRWAAGVVLVTTPEGIGSGAVIDKKERLAITNWHVVGRHPLVSVIFKPVGNEDAANAQAYRAEVVRIDEVADLALIRLAQIPQHVPELRLGDLAGLEVGIDVHAIGHPTGELWTYTKGLVSQIHHNYAWGGDGGPAHRATVIQTQTPINPGNSGGPLLNDDGAIVGINSFVRRGAQGLNYAVSVDDIRTMLSSDSVRRVAATQPGADAAGRAPSIGGRSDGGRPGGSKSCNATRTAIDHDQDGRTDGYSLDEDCDGRIDIIAIDTNGDGRVDTAYLDRNGDGRPDVQILDRDGNGTPELWYVDEDADGKPDVVGKDLDQDGQPDTYRKIAG